MQFFDSLTQSIADYFSPPYVLPIPIELDKEAYAVSFPIGDTNSNVFKKAIWDSHFGCMHDVQKNIENYSPDQLPWINNVRVRWCEYYSKIPDYGQIKKNIQIVNDFVKDMLEVARFHDDNFPRGPRLLHTHSDLMKIWKSFLDYKKVENQSITFIAAIDQKYQGFPSEIRVVIMSKFMQL